MKILLSRDVIAARVKELAAEISTHYQGQQLHCIALMNGALTFTADLIRDLDVELSLDTLNVSSYCGHASSGELSIRSVLKIPVTNRAVLLIDDILDTGLTLKKVCEHLREAGATDVKTCVLLDKAVPRKPGALEHADFTGFHIGDEYVAGYGIDDNEFSRNLPDVIVCE